MDKDDEIKKLREQVAKLENSLSECQAQLEITAAGGEVSALSSVFTEAKKFADNIIYEAKKRSADIIADAQNKAVQMETASENFRAVILADTAEIRSGIETVRKTLEETEKTAKNALERLKSAEELLCRTEEKLKENGNCA